MVIQSNFLSNPTNFGQNGSYDRLYTPAVFNIQNNSPSTSETSQSTKKKQDPRKMWVQVKATGDMLEINLDKDRPVKFDSKDAEVCLTFSF